jgi:opacity protein-like surface antigen
MRYVLLFLAFAPSVGAQQLFPETHVEVAPYGGSRFGGVIQLNSGPYSQLNIRSTWDYGAWLDVRLLSHLQAEFLWNHQPTVLSGVNYLSGATSRVGQANLDFYQWGLLVPILSPYSRVQPYFAGGLGFTDFTAHNAVEQFLPFSNRFSYNIGGGVKYFFTRNFGLRLDARYSPTETTTSFGIFCSPFFGCYRAQVTNFAQQGTANLGLIFRF